MPLPTKFDRRIYSVQCFISLNQIVTYGRSGDGKAGRQIKDLCGPISETLINRICGMACSTVQFSVTKGSVFDLEKVSRQEFRQLALGEGQYELQFD